MLVPFLMSVVMVVSLLTYALCFALPLSCYKHCPMLGDAVYKLMAMLELETEDISMLHIGWAVVVCLVFLFAPSKINMLATLSAMVVNCWVIWSMSWISGARRRCRILHAKTGLH